jgi:hypothetical protein
MNKQSLNFYSTLAILFLNTTLAFGQCVVCVDAPPLITCGETATLTGDGFLTSIYEDNFNSGIGALWNSISTGGSTTSPCTGASSSTTINCAGAGAVPAGDFLWWGQGTAVPRQATTIPIPVPAGGDIIFEFKMEGQGGSCDGPDLIGEGTMLQYRVGAGIWQDVTATMWPFSLNPMPYTNKAYFCPTSPALQSFNTWAQYSIPIPAAAFSAATQFRWRQISPTSQQWDFWGLDNVNISPSSAGGATYTWTTPTGPIAGQALTVSPTSSTNYTFTYTNNGISCNTIVAVNVAPPVVTPSIIINPLNPCPNTIELSAEASFNSCNYNVYLYDNGGDGWTTIPQTSTSIDNRIEVYVDGILINTITMNNGYGPFVYSFPVTSGGTFETKFLSGGPNPNECAYFVEDNQGQLIIDPTSPLVYPNNAISAMGLITSPGSPFWPVPGAIPPSPGFDGVPLDFGPIATVCPTTNPYTYSWSTFPGGSTAGITTPADPTTIVTVSTSPQDYEVCITDQLNPGCIGCSTITVPGNPSIGTFDFAIVSNPLCNDGSTLNITFELSSTTISSGNFNFDLQEVDAAGAVLSTTPLIFTTSPHIFDIPIPNSSGTFNYQVVNLSDASGCPITVNLPNPLSLTLNDPPNAGTNIINPIALCKNDITNFYLPNNLTGSPDLNGTWSFLGAGSPDPTLPFIGFNYTLDPALFPATAIGTFHTFQYEVSPLPGCPTPSINTILVSIEDAPNAGILPTSALKICLDGTTVDLNSLFNSTTACPSCIQPNPFTGANWTDVTGGLPGTTILSPANWTPTSSTTYTIRYTADVSINCPSTDFEEITIIVSDIPTASFSTNTTANEACLNDIVELIFSPTGIGPFFDIQYLDPNSTIQSVTVDANSNDMTGLPIIISTAVAGPFLYTIIDIVDLGAGASGCTGNPTTSVILTVIDPPNAGITTSNTICEDDITIHNLNTLPFFTGGDVGGAWTYGMNPVTSGTFQASDISGNIGDPFGAYTYTVTGGICPDASTLISINAETPPNSGMPNPSPVGICVNDISITNYDLSQLLDGSQDITGSWLYNGIAVASPIDLTSPIFDLGTPAISTAFSFSYQLVPADPLSSCTNNGALPYSTSSIITIHPEPKIDPTTPTANPLVVPQSISTNIFVNMLEGTPPFTVNLLGNETPLGIYLPFVINPGMSGSGPATPNYDILNNPVTISITSITDGNNCISIPSSASVNVTVEPFPLITVNSSSIEQCEGIPLDIIFEGIQGLPTIDIDLLINGTSYSTTTSGLNGITILNTPTSSDISSLLMIGSNLVEIINIVDAGGNICPTNLLPPNFTIIINENPTFLNSTFFFLEDTICENVNAEISFNITSGLAPFTIDYDYTPLSPGLSQITCNTTHTEVLQLLPGDYTFFITSFTDDNGCIGILPPNIPLLVNETPIITLNSFMPAEICEGNIIPLNLQTPINLSTPAVPYTLVINDIDTFFINNNGTIFSGANIGDLIEYTENNAGIYPFIITEFYDDNGCGIIDLVNNSAILTVNENADMIVTSTADTGEVCKGDLAYINFEFTKGTAPWEVTFSKNLTPIILPPYNNSITIPQSLYTYNTSYDIISLKDAKGCNKDPFDKDFDIIANPLPIAELYSDDRFICDDGSTTEMIFTINSGSPGYNVSYSIGLENKFLNIITNSTPLALNTNQVGIWQITEVVDSKGCIADEKGDKITISANTSPVASFVAYPQPTDVNNPFVSFIDNSTGHTNAVWNFYNNITNDTLVNNSRFIHEFSAIADTHFVTLNIISDSGCVSSITQTIFINESFSCFIPTSFTPNNDLFNDYFLPITRGVKEYKLSVYDRLGASVFETNKFTDQYCMNGCEQAWDGKVNNSTEYATAGNYVYSIVIIDFNGKERFLDGTIILIR